MPFGEFVHLHMQYCSFVNSILKHLTLPFLTPARKPTVNFYLLHEAADPVLGRGPYRFVTVIGVKKSPAER